MVIPTARSTIANLLENSVVSASERFSASSKLFRNWNWLLVRRLVIRSSIKRIAATQFFLSCVPWWQRLLERSRN